MLISAKAGHPISVQLDRKGGTVITARLDVWRATTTDWVLEASLIYQKVTSASETQQVTLAPGSYSAVIVCRVEESINGAYEFNVKANGSVVASKVGNVDTTANPHDAEMYKNQFAIELN